MKPLRIRIVRAGDGDTVASLSRGIRGSTDGAGFFRILNGLGPDERVVEGQYYKAVTY